MVKKLNLHLFLIFSMIVFVLFPFASHAQSDVTGGGAATGITYECSRVEAGKTIYGDCTFQDLIRAVQKFFGIAIPLALAFSVVIIAYAGFDYMISGANPSKRTEANKMFIKVAWGIFFMLAAWLIVNLISNALLNPNIIQLVPLG